MTFTIKGRGSNPLHHNKKATDKHPDHKTYSGMSKACFICLQERTKKTNNIIPCPNCKLFTLHLRSIHNDWDMENEAEIYCSACSIYWGRTKNW